MSVCVPHACLVPMESEKAVKSPGTGVTNSCESTSDLQAGLALPSAIFVDRLACVETSIAPFSSQDPQAAKLLI